ncbi:MULTISPECIES: hypothetical protein [unclassified Streptomyces]|uniref:hypothetical protein n=1 Tax=unclassified Streptomyces TaxID=2593676 RepID=UPI0024B68445|nr:hypothetical protein [Streptomyces sp. KAU_LT]MDI9831935.1 hypothetical protein [Streptomyces sp. KAU_LT]
MTWWTRGVVVGATAALAAAGGTAPAPAAPRGAGAEVAYHGSAVLSGGLVGVRFTPHNHGPAAVPESVVRVRWSEPLADGQVLPPSCARSEERAVVCRVGPLEADGVGEPVVLRVRLRQASPEVRLEFATVADGDRAGAGQRVLVLETGDAYAF